MMRRMTNTARGIFCKVLSLKTLFCRLFGWLRAADSRSMATVSRVPLSGLRVSKPYALFPASLISPPSFDPLEKAVITCF
ncbi:hypothetical protein F4802DRAFT_162358 [Xylaria palmicola]|nr:hypothetical protein F4802DRAFT_162358 [Xylaria palmicola]